jgi:hypothetical protein
MEPTEKLPYATESQDTNVPRVEDRHAEDWGEPGSCWESYSLSILSTFFDHC